MRDMYWLNAADRMGDHPVILSGLPEFSCLRRNVGLVYLCKERPLRNPWASFATVKTLQQRHQQQQQHGSITSTTTTTNSNSSYNNYHHNSNNILTGPADVVSGREEDGRESEDEVAEESGLRVLEDLDALQRVEVNVDGDLPLQLV